VATIEITETTPGTGDVNIVTIYNPPGDLCPIIIFTLDGNVITTLVTHP
jgi:hypothetical protein